MRKLRWVLAFAWLFSVAGCSTISGTADLVGGIARDVKDMAEGTRDRMAN